MVFKTLLTNFEVLTCRTWRQ